MRRGATKFSHIVFDLPQLKDEVIEPEIKYLLVLLLVFMYFASLGNGQARPPAELHESLFASYDEKQ